MRRGIKRQRGNAYIAQGQYRSVVHAILQALSIRQDEFIASDYKQPSDRESG